MHGDPVSIKKRIKNALRIDRAFQLVWSASRGWTILSICLTVVQGIMPLLALYIMKLIVDAITLAIKTGDGTTAFRDVSFLVGAAAAVAILQAGMRLAGEYVSGAQALIVTDHVTHILHEKSIQLDLSYYENSGYYDTLHRAQQEGPHRPTRIVNGLTKLLQNGVSLAAMVGLLFMFHWGVGIMLFVSTIPGMFVQIIYARKCFEWQKKRTQDERRASYLSNLLIYEVFAKEVRLFDLGGYFSTMFDRIRTVIRGEKMGLSRGRLLGDFFAQVFGALVLMSCLLLIAYRAVHGAITIGDMVMYFQAFQRGINHLKDFLKNVTSLYEDNMFIAYYFEFLDIKNRVVDPVHPKILPSDCPEGISLDHVGFTYDGVRDAVLKDVSLTIHPGEVVALVGANGAGKSTLVKLLCRLYDPQEGTISMEGVPIHELSIKELREQISVVFQDFSRYYLTVKENIWLGDISSPPDPEKIKEAAIKADADGFIEKLPKGYDTFLGRGWLKGEELSIGEWQKVVLARAFLRQSRLIILDEPTSSLDVNTEYHLYNKFKELIAGRSALLISHRFSTVSMADRIYVMSDGTIAEQGTHKELMAVNGIYADMYTKQANWLTDLNKE